jgi:capsular exopolysaccharide synthesis family protein
MMLLKLNLEPSPAGSPDRTGPIAADDRPGRKWSLPEVLPAPVKIDPRSRIVIHTAPHSAAADRIRQIKLRLHEAAAARNLKTVLITSPTAHDGKSMLALNLATALAGHGNKNVLLLEADLHHGGLAGLLALPSGAAGLAECIEESREPLSVIRRLDPLGWYLLPAGQPNGSPTDLLQKEAFGAAIRTLSAQFDWVVIDSPPVVPVSDALLLRRHADATLLVVRSGSTQRDDVEEAIRQLGREHVFGIVLNGVEDPGGRYDRYGSRYYGLERERPSAKERH